MRFGAPWALVALTLVPFVFLGQAWLARRTRRRLAAAGDIDLFRTLTDGGGPGLERTRLVQTALFAAALGLTIVALARPQLGMKTEVRRGRGMDVVVALDLSRSMHARDVVPSRLARAKIELGVLIEGLRGDRVGLVGFTSIGLPLCPLTVDHAALRIQLRDAEPDDLPRGGTSVAAALRAGMRMLEAAGHEEADKAIVVLTDGEAHLGDPVEAAREANEKGIVVHVAGVGSRVGEPIPETNARGDVIGYVRDASGKTVMSRLDEDTLRRIASAGGGKLALPAGDGGLDLGPIVRHLASLRKADLEARTVRVYEERYTWVLVPAFLCLLLATLIRPTRRPGLPRAMLTLPLLLLPVEARAQDLFRREHPKVRAGIEALQAGRAEEARAAFDEASKLLGEDPRLTYDRALADAARGELDEAMRGFRAAAERAEDPNLRARAKLGLGNALRKLKKLDEAASAYREALLEDPTVEAARRNLELTQAMKAIQAAQPPSEDGGDGDRDPAEEGDERPDAGSPDGGSGGDAGASGSDGGQSPEDREPDGGTSDAGGRGGSDSGETPDAASDRRSDEESRDAGVPPPPEGGPDAGPADAGGQGAGASDREPPPDLSRQEAEAILDALQSEEKALERKRLLERFKGRAVEKDW